ncbi:hypothetical protein R70723_06825 [Paenibacillus sp. FSL R7-0273]|uniref:hypothetical protein n=1 Tax=Paenibacillus sp. FSL R7-0273 TaxID=1536772 RepID=UPI0004F6278F|nr:hypothetical protein [Paenibacillus sp. FSL R7-0273]AIQ45638.1 hypothetical protein R70723_06825 [Paenibacillus sp. FSL R7-0273]OMF95159.1 hypothetical protein BK144_06380 [Paenibacillus sp. FSL R7-0273]
MKIKVTTLDDNLNEELKEYDLSELEVDDDWSDETIKQVDTTLEAASKECEDKTIMSFDLPDGVTCTWRGCRVRMRVHRLYAEVCYPSDTEEAVKEAIMSCFKVGLRAAAATVSAGIIVPAVLKAAVAAAAPAFKGAFVTCMASKMSDAITVDVKYESYRR